MTDLISREDAIHAVNKAFDRETLLNTFVRSIAVKALNTMPSAEPVRHGRWIYIYKKVPVFNYQCSECEARSILFENFCSYCGVRMDKE